MNLDGQIFNIFLVFCRIGACLAVVPGLSTARVPARVRLYLAVALAMMVGPIVEPAQGRTFNSPADLMQPIFAESMAGLMIGMVARLFIEALEFAGSAIANYVGLSSLSSGVDSADPEPAVSSLIVITGTLLLMLLEFPQHLVVVLVDSYQVLPSSQLASPVAMLQQYANVLSTTFIMSLQITAPFMIFAIIMHSVFAILGKLVPQVQSYFLSGPFLALGGLFLLYFAIAEMLRVFASVFVLEFQRL